MRPNIDISWSHHGQIKDLAEQRDLELSDAYELVIENGLEETDQ